MDNAQALACGIGYAAMASARLDSKLRWLLASLLGDGNFIPSYLLLEGRSTEWLRDSIKLVLHEIDPYFRTWPEKAHVRLCDLLEQARRLQDLRNTVIHGEWNNHAAQEESDIRARPRGPRWGRCNSTSSLNPACAR